MDIQMIYFGEIMKDLNGYKVSKLFLGDYLEADKNLPAGH